KVRKIVNLPESVNVVIHDFIQTTLTLNKGKFSSTKKQPVRAVEPPTTRDLTRYAKRLRKRLNEFAEKENISHLISIICSPRLTVCQITPVETPEELKVMVTTADGEWADKLAEIE